MATVGLNFIKTAAQEACQAAAATVTVTVNFNGGDSWDTGSGSVSRDFSIELEG